MLWCSTTASNDIGGKKERGKNKEWWNNGVPKA